MESDARFAHLLQPIRDLAKNWEVDIASHLEDYVAEMEAIVISFDGGSTTMNFAEAALLIQGSACIYSKKVEYLYALVYQTLDLLASKKKMQQACSVDAEGKDTDASFAFKKNEIEFLSLDDLPVAKNIDLKEENDRNHNLTGHLLAQTPLSLLKVEGADRGIPLTNRKGETVGYKGDFRINSSMFHSSRALLIDPSHLSLLEQSMMRHPASTPANFILNAPFSPVKNDNVIPDIPDDIADDIPKHDMSADDVEMGLPFDDLIDDDDQQPMQVEERRALRARVVAPIKPIKEFVDPWEPLDPHDTKGAVLKPFKKGKSFKLPSAMSKNAGKGRKRKKQPVQEKTELCPLVEFINRAYFSHASKLPSNPLKLPYHEEFEYLYYTEYKKQLDTSRREKRRLAQQGKFEELAKREQEEAEEDDDYHGNDVVNDDGGDNFGFDGPEDVFEEDVDQEDRLQQPLDNDQLASSQDAMITSYEELVRKHVEAYLASASEYAQMTELSKRVQQWEDRITPVLAREEKFAYFDINEYGKFVLERLDNVQKASQKKEKVMTFAEVMEDRQIHEVSRYFLATLQLANNYNVEVSSKGPGQEGMDTMALKLLNMKQHHENMAEYRAPSVDDNKH
ncbi:condensin-2 complex subunit H2-like isoform X2 [Lytechinus variegatus]|nr:condensin-2 complex subunit H2-like [Lytechinus variegatus]XP_041472216.1 condensin-2 complex subunit H2-like isoform X2 [Lytechinus variegatus]